MSREIKFRVRDVSGGDWFYFDLTSTHINIPAVASDGEVQQYTGLKDKNGTEIYEGDILAQPRKAPDKKLVNHSVVKFGQFNIGGYEDSCETVGFYRSDKWDSDVFIQDLDSYTLDEYEVCGNIYENPELLKGANS